jgi:hypothetical protein
VQTIKARARLAKNGSALSAEEVAVVRTIERRLRKKTA